MDKFVQSMRLTRIREKSIEAAKSLGDNDLLKCLEKIGTMEMLLESMKKDILLSVKSVPSPVFPRKENEVPESIA